jgi:undecaprenyl-diphosphatase
MDLYFQAVIMGIVQGLTEFLPISSSGHLIVVPYLFGWNDPYITSLNFSVLLNIGTLAALLIYFAADWRRLIPAGLAAIRDRSFRDDPDRRLAWLLLVASVPAALAGFLFSGFFETTVHGIEVVTAMLVVGAGIMWAADRWGGQSKGVEDVTFPVAIGLGAAQALALIPGISRSGVSISAGRFAGLDRASAARFSFLMATPIVFGAVLFESRKLLGAGNGAGADVPVGPLIAGTVASFIAGVLAIRVLLAYLRGHSLLIFVAYRLVLAAIIVVFSLARR